MLIKINLLYLYDIDILMKYLFNFIVYKIFFLKIVEESVIKYMIRVQNFCIVYYKVRFLYLLFLQLNGNQSFYVCVKFFLGFIKMYDN